MDNSNCYTIFEWINKDEWAQWSQLSTLGLLEHTAWNMDTRTTLTCTCTRELVTLLNISSDIITCLSFHHISLFITISSIRISPRSHASVCCYIVIFFLLPSLDSLFRIFFSFLKIQHSKGTKTSTLRL